MKYIWILQREERYEWSGKDQVSSSNVCAYEKEEDAINELNRLKKENNGKWFNEDERLFIYHTSCMGVKREIWYFVNRLEIK